jgi:hypothetical protein
MAEFNSTVYTAQKATRANPSRLATQNSASGTIQVAKIPYTLAATEVANDTINLCVLPAGAIPLPELSSVVCSADPGTTLTLDIGNADNPDGWADGIVLSAGGQVACTNTAIPAWVADTPIVTDSGFATAGSAVIYATVASANTLTASVVLYFNLAYKLAK